MEDPVFVLVSHKILDAHTYTPPQLCYFPLSAGGSLFVSRMIIDSPSYSYKHMGNSRGAQHVILQVKIG
jgi:hypothetical protein